MSAKRWQVLGAVVLLGVAGWMAWKGDPTVDDRLARMAGELDAKIDSRDVHIDPGELLKLMQNSQIRLTLLDARTEAEFNLFHLRDALHVGPARQADGAATALRPEAVKVVVSNVEARANATWRRLRALGVLNVYVLSGGLHNWFGAYGAGAKLDDVETALGDRHPMAAPDPFTAPKRKYEKKVEVLTPIASAGGGCG